jgi:hypothetical protein
MHVECGGEMVLKHTSVDTIERGRILDRVWRSLARCLEVCRESENEYEFEGRERDVGRNVDREASAKEPRCDNKGGANPRPWLMRSRPTTTINLTSVEHT